MTGLARVLALGAWLAVAGCGPSADSELLTRSWTTYRTRFITAEGRVVRPESGNDTVSEGQAYALLRAAWMDDQVTFDRVWRWTDANLGRRGRPHPSLLAWRWSPDAGVVDWNVASDADADVALALLLAAGRWPGGVAAYREPALAILRDLIDQVAVTDESGLALFLPGEWADQRTEGRGLVLNPSYLAPASFRVFHEATDDPRWLALVDGAYEVLEATCARPGGGVPPDWIRWWSRERWIPEGAGGGTVGWDAVRVPWRIATDVRWSGDPRARAYLARCLEPFVRRQLRAGMGLAVEYDLEGRPQGSTDHPLANALLSFALDSTPAERDRLLARVERQLIQRGTDVYFGEPDRYYVNSLAYLPFLARAGRHTRP